VSKIEKARLFKGAKGTYLDLTTFVDLDNQDKYENNGFVSQSVSKEERDAKVQTPILGNVKVFYREDAPADPAGRQYAKEQAAPEGFADLEDEDVPF
jgi:hypothetical protein